MAGHFQISLPPPNHNGGLKLSQEKMYAAFLASHAPATPPAISLKELVEMLKLTVTMPGGTVVLPLAEALRPPSSSSVNAGVSQ